VKINPYSLKKSIEKNPIENNLNMKNNDPQLVHRKVAVLGFRAVGKTSLSNSFVNGTFDETYDPTIENTHHKIIRFRKVNFATDIVDTAGMDEYSRLSRSASVGVDGYVLVYSIISRQSFERIQHINENLLSALGDDISIPRVLVGSICDLNHERQVSYRVSEI
jgi:Ras family protein